MRTTYMTLPLLCLAAACATAKPPDTSRQSYVPAQPVVETSPSEAVAAQQAPPPAADQVKRLPDAGRAAAPKAAASPARPESVVAAANRRATHGPDENGFFNAVMTYTYEPGAVYQVVAAPNYITDIQLQPGEQIVGKPIAGDTVRWKAGVAKGAQDGAEVQHVYIKPLREGLQTTLAINTNRRTYRLELKSYADVYMVAIQWTYPQEDLELEGQGAVKGANKPQMPTVDLATANFAYRVEVMRGKPSWKPTRVFDDGKKTFIAFPASMVNREAPALFVLSRTNETQLVNYRVRGHLYEVDRLFDSAELRLGQQDQDIVRIVRN